MSYGPTAKIEFVQQDSVGNISQILSWSLLEARPRPPLRNVGIRLAKCNKPVYVACHLIKFARGLASMGQTNPIDAPVSGNGWAPAEA